ncbi:Acyl-CoA N-acyltransferase [Penicillium cf. griseofulvum]|nr:Acyl-CoA N-acyltransferase [Penicillium cf. griseofulvum]
MAPMVSSPCREDSFTATKPKHPASHKTAPHTSPSNSQGAHNSIASPGQSTDIATEDFEIISALKLIAVSVDQQRHIAAIFLILHPTTMALVAVSFVYSLGAVYHNPSDWPYISIICATAVSATLGIVARLTWKYHDEAEKVGTLNWLCRPVTTTEEDPAFNSDNEVTFVLIHRFGRRIVGALGMSVTYSGIQPHPSPNGTTLPTGENYNAFIRAWTVQKGFRSYGVGAALLNEAIMICYEHKWKRLRFANSHANSLRVFLPTFRSDMDQEFALWSSYLRKRTEANRQSRAAFEARILHASLNMRLTCTQVKLEELVRRYFNVRLEKAFEAQARWKKIS